ncbi:MAG: cellulase family glycosylhydrolase [Patescibacteria group bacterium]|jgi:hypothetical protein
MKKTIKFHVLRVLRASVILFLLLPVLTQAREAISGGFGVNMHLRQRVVPDEWDTALNLAEENNVEWAREEFNWDVIEPTDDNYNWEQYDALITKYQENNIQVLGLITYSSSWASSNAGDPDYEYYPPDMTAWSDYVSNVAARYAGKVDTWEIWNEPNYDGFWKSNEENYVSYLEEASNKIKQANPNAKVVLGGMSGADTDFLNRIYELTPETDPFDIVAAHPYRVVDDNFNYSPEQTTDGLNTLTVDLESMRAVMRDNGDKDMPIWLTEFGWTTYDNGVSEEKQTDYLMRGYAGAFANSQVRKIFWYTFRDDSDNTAYLESSFGLARNDYTAKPALAAFKFMQEKLTDKKYQLSSLANATVIDNFDKKNNWEFSGAINSDGYLEEAYNGQLKINYYFNGTVNSYLPVHNELKLPNYTKALSFKAKGSNGTTFLRVRVKDKSGETFQYNIGYLPSSYVNYRINLKNYSGHWNGNEDGDLDYPIYFESFVLDDNPDGSREHGSVYFDDLQSSKLGGVYLYNYTQGKNNYYLAWTRGQTRNYNLNLDPATEIMKRSLAGNESLNAENHRFAITLSQEPVWLQVKK